MHSPIDVLQDLVDRAGLPLDDVGRARLAVLRLYCELPWDDPRSPAELARDLVAERLLPPLPELELAPWSSTESIVVPPQPAIGEPLSPMPAYYAHVLPMADGLGLVACCAVCGCTERVACDDDGMPCHWAAPGICSACI